MYLQSNSQANLKHYNNKLSRAYRLCFQCKTLYFWKFSQPTSNIALVLKFLIAMQLQQNFTKGWQWLWFYPGPCILTLRYWNTVSLDQKITFLMKERKRTHLQAGFYGTPFMIWALQLRGDQINLAISLLPALHGRSDGPSYHLRHMLYKGWHISLCVQTTLSHQS